MKGFLLAAVLLGALSLPGGALLAGNGYRIAVDTPCFVRGLEDRVRCVSLQVPLDWRRPWGASIRIVAAIVPALSARSAPDALVVLAGGPGQGATDYAALVSTAFREVHKSRDIVLFDQRGTGHSGALNCSFSSLRRPAWPTQTTFVNEERRCLAHLHTDPRFYGLNEVVQDLDALRTALGYQQIDLWGGSYGTLTAQQYVRRYGSHVRAVVLDGAVPVDRSLLAGAAGTADAALQGVWNDCAAQAPCSRRYPDARHRFDAFLARLEERPPSAIWDRDTVAQTVRTALYVPMLRALIPATADAAERGNYEPLSALYAEGASWSSDTMALGATLSVLCADEAGRVTPAEARALGVGFTRDSYYRFWSQACAGWPTRPSPRDFRQPLTPSRVPALVLSGGLDPATPPSSGARVARQFLNARHIVIPDAGHNVSFLGCAPKLIGDFIEQGTGAPLNASCVLGVHRPQMVTL